MKKYLESSAIINWKNSHIKSLADILSNGLSDEEQISKACFEWVRDNIQHSVDFKMNPVTCKASDVLQHQTGYCYAKSHLLAALLRANGIPAGLCYQRLSVHDDGAPFCLHGLNAVYLKKHGWYRVDARGNKKGINAQFTPPEEQLAFSFNFPQEVNLPEIWSEPLSVVVSVLNQYSTWQQVQQNLPDIDLLKD
jgi:transglutaminase-like putative cysteine protease